MAGWASASSSTATSIPRLGCVSGFDDGGADHVVSQSTVRHARSISARHTVSCGSSPAGRARACPCWRRVLKRSSLIHLLPPFAAHDDLQGLRQEALGHVVCVVTLAQFSASRASNRPRSSAHSITTVPGFRFSLHIGCRIPAALNLRLYEQETASRELEEIGFRYSAINAWVQDVDCELFHCLPGADRTIGRSRAPDRA